MCHEWLGPLFQFRLRRNFRLLRRTPTGLLLAGEKAMGNNNVTVQTFQMHPPVSLQLYMCTNSFFYEPI